MVLKYIGILLNTQWHGLLGGFRSASSVRKLATILVGLAFLVLVIFNFFFAFFVANIPHLLENADFDASRFDPSFDITTISGLATRLLSLLLLAAFTVLLFSGFSTTLSSLYLSKDMDLLLTAPIPMRSVFVVKLGLGLGLSYVLLLGFGLPYIVGLGLGLGYNPLFYPVAVLALLALPLIPIGLSAIGVVALVRVLPPGRIKEILAVVGALFGIIFYLIVQLPSLLSNSGDPGSMRQTGRAIGQIALNEQPLFPSTWASRTMEAAGTSNFANLAAWGSLYFGLSILIFVGCLLLAERAYYNGWANIGSVGGRSRAELARQRADRPATDYASTELKQLPPSDRIVAALKQSAALKGGETPDRPAQAIMDKDITTLRRDLTGFAQLLWPIAVAIVLLFNLRRGSDSLSSFDFDTGRLDQLGFIWPVLTTVFSSFGIAAYFGLASISRERKSIWMLKIAPVSWWSVLAGKFVLTYVPLACFGSLIAVVYALITGLTAVATVEAIVLSLLVNFGVTGICVGLGGMLPNFAATNPQQQTSTAAGCLFFPIMALYLLLTIGSIALGVVFGGSGFSLPLALGLFASIVITLLAAWLPLKLAHDSLERLEL